MSVTRHHAEWLSLLEVSGPFLSMPVLLKAFPKGWTRTTPRYPEPCGSHTKNGTTIKQENVRILSLTVNSFGLS